MTTDFVVHAFRLRPLRDTAADAVCPHGMLVRFGACRADIFTEHAHDLMPLVADFVAYMIASGVRR